MTNKHVLNFARLANSMIETNYHIAINIIAMIIVQLLSMFFNEVVIVIVAAVVTTIIVRLSTK